MTDDLRGRERIQWITQALDDSRIDALVCCLPSNVLLLSGYWPVVGTSVAVATADGRVAILAPEDEDELARAGWADEVRLYQPGSLEDMEGPVEKIVAPLGELMADLELDRGVVGVEERAIFEESSYSAVFRFQSVIGGVVQRAARDATITSADHVLTGLRARLTQYEASRIALACTVSREAFTSGVDMIRTTVSECQVAEAFEGPIQCLGLDHPDVRRAGAFTWCMSGQNSAKAGGAYARSTNRKIEPNDLVLVHCNSYVDGYFTDITRTYCLGQPDSRGEAMYSAIFRAREAALSVIEPGARAAEVDAAGRKVLVETGFAEYFTHGIGHNVGFTAISSDFPPRLHPASPDRLEVGATFNLEPSIYIPGYGGIRHCDVVTLTENGPVVLTDFQQDLDSLILPT